MIKGTKVTCSYSVNPARYGGDMGLEEVRWLFLTLGLSVVFIPKKVLSGEEVVAGAMGRTRPSLPPSGPWGDSL